MGSKGQIHRLTSVATSLESVRTDSLFPNDLRMRFMERLDLQRLDANRDHEPDFRKSLQINETVRRFMESLVAQRMAAHRDQVHYRLVTVTRTNDDHGEDEDPASAFARLATPDEPADRLISHRPSPIHPLVNRKLGAVFRQAFGRLMCVAALVLGWSGLAATGPEPQIISTGWAEDILVGHDSGFLTNRIWIVTTSLGIYRFGFRPIPNWTMRLNAQRCQWEAQQVDGEASLSVRYEPSAEADSEEALKELALGRNGGFEFQAFVPLTATLGPTVAMDLVAAGFVPILTDDEDDRYGPRPWRRVAFIQGEGFRMECVLRTRQSGLTGCADEFARFLLSLHKWTRDPGSLDR